MQGQRLRSKARVSRAIPRRRRVADDANGATRRERGEGVAVAGRGAGELCEAGRGDCARSATFSERASRHSAWQHTARGGMADVSRAGPKGSHARRSPWELPSSGGGQWRASVASNPAGNARSHKGERWRASPEWRRSRARASEGRAWFVTIRASHHTSGQDARKGGLWRMLRGRIQSTTPRDAGILHGAGGGVRRAVGEQVA